MNIWTGNMKNDLNFYDIYNLEIIKLVIYLFLHFHHYISRIFSDGRKGNTIIMI